MIEFAPNPSGPAHLGTARTYLAAWLLAKERGETMSVRFDGDALAVGLGGVGHELSEVWADTFLNELQVLGVPPDRQTYLGKEHLMLIDRPREDLPIVPWPRPSVVEAGWSHLSSEDVETIDSNPDEWLPGGEVPMWLNPAEEVLPYAFLVRGVWTVSPAISHMLYCHLRGVTAVVRSLISQRLSVTERLFAERLSIPLSYEVIHHAVVVTDEGALSKHRLQAADPGTLNWAIREHGPEFVRSALERSLREDGRDIIPYAELLGGA